MAINPSTPVFPLAITTAVRVHRFFGLLDGASSSDEFATTYLVYFDQSRWKEEVHGHATDQNEHHPESGKDAATGFAC